MTHPNRSGATFTGTSFVIMLPAVKRLWKHQQAAQGAVFTSAHNAQRVIDGLSGRGALAGAKVMRITDSVEAGAIWHGGYHLIDA